MEISFEISNSSGLRLRVAWGEDQRFGSHTSWTPPGLNMLLPHPLPQPGDLDSVYSVSEPISLHNQRGCEYFAPEIIKRISDIMKRPGPEQAPWKQWTFLPAHHTACRLHSTSLQTGLQQGLLGIPQTRVQTPALPLPSVAGRMAKSRASRIPLL